MLCRFIVPPASLLIPFALVVGQVHIKERVEISPLRPRIANTTANSVSTLRFEATFTGGVRTEPGYPSEFSIIDGCGVQTNLDFPGSVSAEVQARGGFTQARIIFYPSSAGQMTLTWSVDGTVLRSETSNIACSDCRIDLQPYFQLYTGFSFDMGTYEGPWTRHGESRAISVGRIDGGLCATSVWAPEFPVTLALTSGQQFGSFHNSSGDSLGSSVTVRGFEIPSIHYRADGVQPDSILGQVSVQASSGGMTQEVSFSVLRTAPSPTWIRLRSVPDISYGGERTIVADAIDMVLTPVRLPSSVTYRFEIIQGAQWGTFVRGSKSGDIITGVPQFSSRFVGSQGFVFFHARDQEPMQPQTVTIKVSASDTTVKPANLSFRVVPSPFVVRSNPNPVNFGGSALIEPKIKVNDTTFVAFPTDANLYYEIVKGQGIGTLQTPDSQFTGGSISGQYQQMRFNAGAQGSLPDSQEVWVWLIVNNGGSGHSNLNNAQGLGKVLVVKKVNQLDHFEVTLEKDTVAFTETSKIFVQAKDADDHDIDIDPSTLLRVELLGESAYGTFINKNGDTLKTTPVKLENIAYDDAKTGVIRFAAVEKNPDSVITCKIRVDLQSDATKKGEKEIVVLEHTLKIVIEGRPEVQPVNPPATVNAPRAENRKPFMVRLTRGGKPVASHDFTLRTDYIASSGGHDHVQPRRTTSRDNYGHFILLRTSAHHDMPYTSQTQTDGTERFDYVASIVGDQMRIRVESMNNALLWDTVSVVEKIPDLINLARTSSNFWNLTGNVGTTSYPNCTGTVIQHQSNHYATQQTLDNLQSVLAQFFRFAALPEEEGGFGRLLKLGINDMSLSNGGLFDICSNWIPGHYSHRRGTSVDIDSRAEDFDNPGVNVNLNSMLPNGSTLLDLLTDLMSMNLARRVREETIHYEF